MTTNEALAAAMFPQIRLTPEDCERRYPPRDLPEGARVTRIAPSPTGYLHLGTFFTAMVNRLTADATGGVFYFRLEDTDKKREVEGGADDILKGLREFGLTIDEGFVAPGEVKGAAAPRSIRPMPGGWWSRDWLIRASARSRRAPRRARRRSVTSSAPGITANTPCVGTSRRTRRLCVCRRARASSCGCVRPAARSTGSSSPI